MTIEEIQAEAEIARLQVELENANRESNFRGELASKLADQLRTAEQEIKDLTECLNGSSKATYTAARYDNDMKEAEQRVARECAVMAASSVARPP